MPLDRWIPSTRRAASRGAAGAAQQEQWRSSCTPIDPQASVQESMEKQMRTDREKRAQILQAEGQKQAAILTAEGEKQAAVLRAQGQREATILQADGQAKAIDTVFRAIHEGNPDPQLLAYQYVQALPQIAQGRVEQGLDHPGRVPGRARTNREPGQPRRLTTGNKSTTLASPTRQSLVETVSRPLPGDRRGCPAPSSVAIFGERRRLGLEGDPRDSAELNRGVFGKEKSCRPTLR